MSDAETDLPHKDQWWSYSGGSDVAQEQQDGGDALVDLLLLGEVEGA